MMNAKKRAIEELMAHLDEKDGEELGAAMKPKEEPVLEVESEEKMPGTGGEPDGDEGMKVEVEAEGSKMSPEEMEELIEAIQSKLGG